MGLSQSVEIPGGGTEGYHVLRVQENSPGAAAGIEAFFDFIVALNGVRLDQDNETLREILKANIDKPVAVTLYNSKSRQVREVPITPSAIWGGQGLLGVSIRFCSFQAANDNVWHVLDVIPGSPAAVAGFRPFTDFIVGADSVLPENEDLFALVEANNGRPLKLYVYNTESDSCREVTIVPNSEWGGEGSLGCDIGYGYLHRIPSDSIPKPPLPRSSTGLTLPVIDPIVDCPEGLEVVEPPAEDEKAVEIMSNSFSQITVNSSLNHSDLAVGPNFDSQMSTQPFHSHPSPPPVQPHGIPSVTPMGMVQTPLNLPGLPPITVSASLPPEALEGLKASGSPVMISP
ncbi:unnamed protein product [Notodromas monacha]|uniref:PDZ GRASP-type domain-containing protein n=1 Tax=Notodromas monacha TaxID=399045 RepID=A0A7R9BGG9_9CRUS|nr:unnamed protein product [Notodromas monacha]CAG0914309.1 unnamed protein product [Notodromas monacha]